MFQSRIFSVGLDIGIFSRFAASAMTRDIIPTRPKYMSIEMISFETIDNDEVIPIVIPTFDRADATSKVI